MGTKQSSENRNDFKGINEGNNDDRFPDLVCFLGYGLVRRGEGLQQVNPVYLAGVGGGSIAHTNLVGTMTYIHRRRYIHRRYDEVYTCCVLARKEPSDPKGRCREQIKVWSETFTRPGYYCYWKYYSIKPVKL